MNWSYVGGMQRHVGHRAVRMANPKAKSAGVVRLDSSILLFQRWISPRQRESIDLCDPGFLVLQTGSVDAGWPQRVLTHVGHMQRYVGALP